MRTQRQKVWIGGVLGLVIVPLAVLAQQQSTSTTASKTASKTASRTEVRPANSLEHPTPMSVPVLTLGSCQPPQRQDRYRGLLVASKEAELAFRRAGRIVRMHVAEGAVVTAGQVLAELDSTDIRASLRGSEAQIAEAEAVLAEMIAGPRAEVIRAAEAEVDRQTAQLNLAIVSEQRQAQLRSTNSVSEQQYDEARFRLAQNRSAVTVAKEQLAELLAGTRDEQISAQQARLASLKANHELLNVHLQDTAIVAPFAGVIARRDLDEGTVVGPERVALRMLQVDPLEAKFGVAPKDVARLAPGTTVTLWADDRPYVATVARVEPELDAATRTQAVYVTVQKSESDGSVPLAPGRTVTLAFDAANPSDGSLWVPFTALAKSNRGMWALYVVVPQESSDGYVIERREVQIREMDGTFACIEGGLVMRGDRVLSQATHRVVPGMRVHPLDDVTRLTRKESL